LNLNHVLGSPMSESPPLVSSQFSSYEDFFQSASFSHTMQLLVNQSASQINQQGHLIKLSAPSTSLAPSKNTHSQDRAGSRTRIYGSDGTVYRVTVTVLTDLNFFSIWYSRRYGFLHKNTVRITDDYTKFA
jgi:hypothetical protein